MATPLTKPIQSLTATWRESTRFAVAGGMHGATSAIWTGLATGFAMAGSPLVASISALAAAANLFLATSQVKNFEDARARETEGPALDKIMNDETLTRDQVRTALETHFNPPEPKHDPANNRYDSRLWTGGYHKPTHRRYLLDVYSK